MMGSDRHTEDFSPYLDGSPSDPDRRGIERHLEECAACRREAGVWKSVDDLVRSHAPMIEVPTFQWQRIAAGLAEPAPRPGFLAWLAESQRRHRLAWNGAFCVLLTVAIALSGLEYRNYQKDKELIPIIAYTEVETQRLTLAGNPFSGYVDMPSDENPFARFAAGTGLRIDKLQR